MRSENILKYSLLAGAVYFASIALAHVTGFKIPGLFIYYDIPSYQYQDNIISFLAFGWAVFFYNAYKNLVLINSILLASFVALIALCNINLSGDLSKVSPEVNTTPLWVQTIMLLAYVSWLFFWSRKVKKTSP